MARIYTRSGDDGTTGLPGGRRVPKNDTTIEALGNLDELNAAIGWAVGAVASTRCGEALTLVQHRLLEAGAQISGGDPTAGPTEEDVKSLERMMDELDSDLPPLRQFILPAGSEAACRLHWTRAVCRRAERHLVALDQGPPQKIRIYLNRLSDLLFVMARHANRADGRTDATWTRRA